MLVLYISVSIGVSFLCSLLESVILSVSPTYLTSLKTTNPKLYAKVKDLKTDIEKPLASILTFNTVAHTIGAAGAGAEAQRVFGNEALTMFSVLLTLGILFFSEIIPKSIGAGGWKKLLPFSVAVLNPMTILAFPLVWPSMQISKLFNKESGSITREELRALTDIGYKEGIIEQDEHRGIQGLITFDTMKVKSIMTLKDEVKAVQSTDSIEQVYKGFQEHSFSRVLVYGVGLDDIKGYIIRSHVLESYINKQADIRPLIKNILILPQNTSLKTLFNRLLKRREHIAALVDEAGHFVGIVTLEDIIENLLGLEIFDELDS